MRKIIDYIIEFLIGELNKSVKSKVSYGDSGEAHVVIEPSGFFEEDIYLTEKSLPMLPLREIEGIPILFGSTDVWEENGQIHIGADLIASAFFLLSRYEECIRRDVRDQHGRFPGKESLPYRAGFLGRPIVEEYGVLLRRYLRKAGVEVSEPASGFSHIWLTHDVDQIWTWNNLYRAMRTVVKRAITGTPEKLRPLLAVWDYHRYDPVSTFPWLMEQDDALRRVYGSDRCTPVYFMMGCTRHKVQDNGYMSNSRRTHRLIEELLAGECEIGYHVSYQASQNMVEAAQEIARIQTHTNRPVVLSRNHYLASREPEDFRALLDCGITDDFTMGYADIAGFRLGTCRPVQWIDPIRRELTPLVLHPMTVMECTLDGAGYMNIQNQREAYQVVDTMLRHIHDHGGEVILLWHSPSVDKGEKSYQRSLYEQLLRRLKEYHEDM